jgi:hypothetical protein
MSGKNFEIGRILQLKSEIRNRKLNWLKPQRIGSCEANQRFRISDFGFELQDSSNFKIVPGPVHDA